MSDSSPWTRLWISTQPLKHVRRSHGGFVLSLPSFRSNFSLPTGRRLSSSCLRVPKSTSVRLVSPSCDTEEYNCWVVRALVLRYPASRDKHPRCFYWVKPSTVLLFLHISGNVTILYLIYCAHFPNTSEMCFMFTNGKTPAPQFWQTMIKQSHPSTDHSNACFSRHGA